MWQEVVERLERTAPAGVMARLALEQALPAQWIDEVFEEHRQRQYPRELLFSTVVELMMPVSLGLRPSLHAAVRGLSEPLPVSLAALYDKVNRTEPQVLRALVQGSAARLAPVSACLQSTSSLPGWQMRVFDGNHLPASEKRLQALRGHRGAALPGHTIVVYDPDSGLVCDAASCEDAYQSERDGAAVLIEKAQAQQVWIGDRHFCTEALLHGVHERSASFIVREHSRHPRLSGVGQWTEYRDSDTGRVREQSLRPCCLADAMTPAATGWRRIEVALTTPTETGDATIVLWSNLPADIDACTIAALYRKRWRIEGMFHRLESALNSEIKSLGHPRAALLGFAVAVLAHNVLALLKRAIEQAHRSEQPELDVSTYHLTLHVVDGYKAVTLALPPEHLPRITHDDPRWLCDKLLQLARHLRPKSLASSKRAPKTRQAKGYVDGSLARAHVSTARVLKAYRPARP